MELDARYVDVIVTRWQDFTGKTATLEGDGSTFGDVKAMRLAPEPEEKDAAYPVHANAK